MKIFIHLFLKAILDEQISGWNIELLRLKEKKHKRLVSLKNKMIIGYLRSLFLTILVFIFSGYVSTLIFLLCAFISNYFEQ